MKPAVRRKQVQHLVSGKFLSERRACGLVGISRSVAQYNSRRRCDAALRLRLKELAERYPCNGYLMLHAFLKQEGLVQNAKRTYRLLSLCEADGAQRRHNGSSYVAEELADFLKTKGMGHVRCRPYHPQTQGKIERWHQTLKNRILLDNYYLPGHLEHEIGEFIRYCSHERYHESLNNLTPADVYFGRGQAILEKRRKLKEDTIRQRRLLHQMQAA